MARILLIEADVVLSAVIREVLRHYGYEVVSLKSLQQGIEQKNPVSAVIVDIDTLSEEKEPALVELLRQYGESLLIVLLGLQVSDDLRQRLSAHLHEQQVRSLTWVQKPFRNEELVAAVRQPHKHWTPESPSLRD